MIGLESLAAPLNIHRVVPEVPSALQSPREFFQSSFGEERRPSEPQNSVVMGDPLDSSHLYLHDLWSSVRMTIGFLVISFGV